MTRRLSVARWRLVGSWVLAIFIAAGGIGASRDVPTARGAANLSLPNKSDSVKFAVIGDFGNGESAEYDIAAEMAAVHAQFPFGAVITTGDNFLGSQDEPSDFVLKFEKPFGPLLQAGVRFYASLGNHDKPENVSYAPLNMRGQRYYSIAIGNVRFFMLDTNLPDRPQLAWIEQALRSSQDPWKICVFHHPLYSDAETHGPALDLRVRLEPLFVQYGVDVVFSGHDHVYERFKPQKDVVYFIAGTGGQLKEGDVRPGAATAAAFDEDRSFVIVEVSGEEMFFQTVARTGATVDGGVIHRRPTS